MTKENTFFLYLEDWQRKMLNDKFSKKGYMLEINLKDVSGPNPPYGVPPIEMSTDCMYLAEWQRREIKDRTGYQCEFINLNKNTLKNLR